MFLRLSTGISFEDVWMCSYRPLASSCLCHGVTGKNIFSLLCFLKLKIQPELFSQVLECDAPGPGGSGALALVGLGVCFGICRLAPPQRVDRLATYRRVCNPSGGLARGTGVGCREREQEGRRQRQCREGERLLPWKEVQGILGSEFSLQGTVCGGGG